NTYVRTEPCATVLARFVWLRLPDRFSIDFGAAGRSGLPAPVDPQPLVRIFADHRFELPVERLGVGNRVAGDRDGWIEFQHEALLARLPNRKTRDHGRAGMRRKTRERAAGTSRNSEEVDEHSLVRRHVLVDENADRLIGV